jgi:hypothetical protein
VMTCGKLEVRLHFYLTLLLNGWKWSASRNGRSTPAENAFDTHYVGAELAPAPVWTG